jgi:hypothetical protein
MYLVYFVKIYYIATGLVPVDTYGISLIGQLLTILHNTLPNKRIKALPKGNQYYLSEPFSFQLFIFTPAESI